MAESTQAAAGVAAYRWRWAALFVILGMEIMDMLDALVTTIAAPTIRADLGGSTALVQWLGAGYTLAMAVGLLTGGRLGDMYGRKRMFIIGTAGFTAASLLCALAQSPEMLISARVLQGLLGAMVLPQGLGMIREMFPPKEMAAAFGAFGPIMGLGAVGGPILAGWLVDADLFGTGWRAIFAINIPIGVATVACALKFLPEGNPHRGSRLDVVGGFLAAVGAGLVVYPLVQGRELGWPAWTFAMMAGSAVVFAGFAWWEIRVVAAGRDPLIQPSLFRKRAFSGGMLVGLALFSAMIGFSLVFTLYLQVGLGWSPLKAALGGSPMAVGMVIGFVAAGVGLAEKFGRRLVHAGIAVMIAGIAAMYWSVGHFGPDITVWQLTPSLGLVGLGMGHAMAPFFDIVLAGVSPRETGSAGGTLTAVQQLGGALGIALLGTVFFAALGPALTERAELGAPALRTSLVSAGVTGPAQDAIVAGVRDCTHDRAVAADETVAPASCGALEAAVGATADPAAVGRIIGAAAQAGAGEGFGDVIRIALLVEGALAAAAWQLTFLLPMRARHDEGFGHGGPGEGEGEATPESEPEPVLA